MDLVQLPHFPAGKLRPQENEAEGKRHTERKSGSRDVPGNIYRSPLNVVPRSPGTFPQGLRKKRGLVLFLGEGNGTPLQYSCLENPMDEGAWWAAVHGVARVGRD